MELGAKLAEYVIDKLKLLNLCEKLPFCDYFADIRGWLNW